MDTSRKAVVRHDRDKTHTSAAAGRFRTSSEGSGRRRHSGPRVMTVRGKWGLLSYGSDPGPQGVRRRRTGTGKSAREAQGHRRLRSTGGLFPDWRIAPIFCLPGLLVYPMRAGVHLSGWWGEVGSPSGWARVTEFEDTISQTLTASLGFLVFAGHLRLGRLCGDGCNRLGPVGVQWASSTLSTALALPSGQTDSGRGLSFPVWEFRAHCPTWMRSASGKSRDQTGVRSTRIAAARRATGTDSQTRLHIA